MTIVSTKGTYGLRALFDLAQHYGPHPVTSAEIAERQQIPEAYLNHLLLTLRNAGLVQSTRGPSGGYTLARSPVRITLAEAVVALEGSISPVEGLETPVHSGEPLEEEILQEVWGEVEAAIARVLESITLDDLCQRKLARKQQVMYYI